MIISDKKKFIFVHVEKAGGTSIVHSLSDFANPIRNTQLSSALRLFGMPMNYHKYRYGRHSPLIDAETRMPRQLFDEYYKFAFVRNPYDRLVSEYNAAIKKSRRARHRKIAALDSFEAFIRFEIKRGKFYQLPLITLSNGEPGLNFVGRFEKLVKDFEKIANKLNIDSRLEKRNAYAHKPYQEYYSNSAKKLVNQHWAEELERFDYRFE